MKKNNLLAIALLLSIGIKVQAQQLVRNLGFEQIDPKGKILSWDIGDTKKQYSINLDTSVHHSGNTSISVESLPNSVADRGVAGAESIFFGSLLRSKRTVKISAFIKTENMKDGVAGIAMRLNGNDKMIAGTDSGKSSKSGTVDWSLCEIELPLTPQVKSLSFALQVTGIGKAWFDDFQIFIDGKLVASSSYEPKSNLTNAL